MMVDHYSTRDDDILLQDNFSEEMEELLIEHINEFLEKDNISQLPVSVIYRIIEKSRKEDISSDLLYEFICKSVETRYVLFTFVEVEKLREEHFDALCAQYWKSKGNENQRFYEYLKPNILYLKRLKEEQKRKYEYQEERINELTERNKSLQTKLNKISQDNNSLQERTNQLEEENRKLREQNHETNKANEAYRKETTKLKNDKHSHEEEINQLRKEKDILREQIKQINDKNEIYSKEISKLKSDGKKYQKWFYEYNLIKLIKDNDYKSFIKIIHKLLSNIKFEDNKSKTQFCEREIFGIANETGTSDLVKYLISANLIEAKSNDISITKIFNVI